MFWQKYQLQAPSWFGIALHPDDQSLLYGYNAQFKWVKDEAMEEASHPYSKGLGVEFVNGKPRKRKIGRPCGSGKKYKKCHLVD
jgi:uncharacterized protein YchJ